MRHRDRYPVMHVMQREADLLNAEHRFGRYNSITGTSLISVERKLRLIDFQLCVLSDVNWPCCMRNHRSGSLYVIWLYVMSTRNLECGTNLSIISHAVSVGCFTKETKCINWIIVYERIKVNCICLTLWSHSFKFATGCSRSSLQCIFFLTFYVYDVFAFRIS